MENVIYRYKYIDRYLEREMRYFRWIQLNEEKYNEMIGNGDTFCGTPYEYYDENGNKKFEFHVDGCPKFAEWSDCPDFDSERFGGCLSVWFPEGAKPLIIFGQDECIFKQYIFTKKS